MPQLLPPNASPLENSFDDFVDSRLAGVPVPVRDMWNPYTCPLSLLPWLAWAFSVDAWNNEWTEERKRNVIANAFEMHKYKGTVGALKGALRALGYELSVTEWFEESEAPYTFAVDVKIVNTGILQQDHQDILAAVNASKNLRSVLREVRLSNNRDVSLAVKCTSQAGNLIHIKPLGV